MPIESSCAQCGKQLRTPDNTAGKQARCPQCSSVMQIPHPATLLPQDEQEFALPGPLPGPTPSGSEFPSGTGGPLPGGEGGFDFNPYASPTTGSYGPRYANSAKSYHLASLGSRFAGKLIDGIISIVAMVPGMMVGMADGNPGKFENAIFPLLNFPYAIAGAVIVAVINWIMITQSGQSIGKKIVGTRIVKLDGRLPGFANGVFLREWVTGFISNFPLVGPFFALADILFIFGAERRCIHDQIAKTRVVVA